MKTINFIFGVFFFFISFGIYAEDKTLDDRCADHADYIIELLKNKYKGESLTEQLDLVEEWNDIAYREKIKITLRDIIYEQPTFYTEDEIIRQALENYIAAYRICVRDHEKN